MTVCESAVPHRDSNFVLVRPTERGEQYAKELNEQATITPTPAKLHRVSPQDNIEGSGVVEAVYCDSSDVLFLECKLSDLLFSEENSKEDSEGVGSHDPVVAPPAALVRVIGGHGGGGEAGMHQACKSGRTEVSS